MNINSKSKLKILYRKLRALQEDAKDFRDAQTDPSAKTFAGGILDDLSDLDNRIFSTARDNGLNLNA